MCLCKAVTDGVIRQAVDDGARTTLDVAEACRAGTGCGGCLPEVRKVVWKHLAGQAEALGDDCLANAS